MVACGVGGVFFPHVRRTGVQAVPEIECVYLFIVILPGASAPRTGQTALPVAMCVRQVRSLNLTHD